MKVTRWLSTVATIGLALAGGIIGGAAAVGDPEIIIYRVVGARDNGSGDFSGIATGIDCTNFSGATQTVRFVARNLDSTVKANATLTIAHLETRAAVTHQIFGVIATSLSTGPLTQGTIAIAATDINIVCTAYFQEAGNVSPHGFSLRSIRFNPVPGSQE